MSRIVLAVIAGFVLWSVLWLVAGAVIRGVVPDITGEDGETIVHSGALLLFLIVAALVSVVSGWLAATLARDGARRAVVILAVVLLVVGLAVEITGWETAPVWYHLVFLGLLVPATVAGGALRR